MSSNHTLVSRQEWSEMQRQVGGLQAYLINSELETTQLRHEYERRIQEIEAARAENTRVVEQAVNALENAYRTTLQEARGQFSEQIGEHSNEFHQQLQDILNDVNNISGQLGRADSRLRTLASRYDAAFQARLEQLTQGAQRAEMILEELDRLLGQIQQLNPERFRPVDYTTLQTLRNSVEQNIQNGDYQAATLVSQGSILTATRVLAQLTVDNDTYGRQLEAARIEMANLQNRINELASDAGVLAVEVQGQRQEFDYDINYWSNGEFQEIQNRLTQVQARLMEPDLSVAELNELGNQVNSLQNELEQCDQRARRAMAGSVFVEETADRLSEILGEQGWEATIDQHHGEDAKAPYTME